MGRRKKAERPGADWHATARGVNRVAIFIDDADYEKYIRLLGDVVIECGWVLLAFCLMPNHVHLLIETPNANLAKGMHLLHSRYARYFNDRYDRVGHLFQDRYHPEPVEDELHFVRCAFYIAANPARAHLCRDPRDYEWSSLGLVSRGTEPAWLAHKLLCERLVRLTGRARPFEDWVL